MYPTPTLRYKGVSLVLGDAQLFGEGNAPNVFAITLQSHSSGCCKYCGNTKQYHSVVKCVCLEVGGRISSVIK